MPNRGFSKIPLENDNITMREIMDKLLERRKMKYRGIYGAMYKVDSCGTLGTVLFCVQLLAKIFSHWYLQGGHGTGKTGKFGYQFSRKGKHREFRYNTGKIWDNTGNFPKN